MYFFWKATPHPQYSLRLKILIIITKQNVFFHMIKTVSEFPYYNQRHGF